MLIMLIVRTLLVEYNAYTAFAPGSAVTIATDIICGFPTESDDDFVARSAPLPPTSCLARGCTLCGQACVVRTVVCAARRRMAGVGGGNACLCVTPSTLQLIRDTRPPMLHISQFYPRPGTVAAKMKQLPSQVTARA
jgi:hypothetical protein